MSHIYKCQIKIFGFESTHVEVIDNLHQYHHNIIQVHRGTYDKTHQEYTRSNTSSSPNIAHYKNA